MRANRKHEKLSPSSVYSASSSSPTSGRENQGPERDGGGEGGGGGWKENHRSSLDLSVTYVEYFDTSTLREATKLPCSSEEATSICSHVAQPTSCNSPASFVMMQSNKHLRSESSSSSSSTSLSSPPSARRGHPKDTRLTHAGRSSSLAADHENRVASLRNLFRLAEPETGSCAGMPRKTGRPKLPVKVTTSSPVAGCFGDNRVDLGEKNSVRCSSSSGASDDQRLMRSPPTTAAAAADDTSDGSGSTPSSPNSTDTLIDSVHSETSLTEDTGNDDLGSSETDADDHSITTTTTTTTVTTNTTTIPAGRYRLPGNTTPVAMTTEKQLKNRPPLHHHHRLPSAQSRLICHQLDQHQADRNGRKYSQKTDTTKTLAYFSSGAAQKQVFAKSGLSSDTSPLLPPHHRPSSDIQRIDTFGQTADPRSTGVPPVSHVLKLTKSTSSTDLHRHVTSPTTQTSVNRPAGRPTAIAIGDGGTAVQKNHAASRMRVPISPTTSVPVKTLRKAKSSDTPTSSSSSHSPVSGPAPTISKPKPACRRDQSAVPPRPTDASRFAAYQRDHAAASLGCQQQVVPQSACGLMGVRSSKFPAVPDSGRLSSSAAETAPGCYSVQQQLSPISEKTAHQNDRLEHTQTSSNDDGSNISRGGSCSPLKSPTAAAAAVVPLTRSLSTTHRATSLSKIPLGKSVPISAPGAIPAKPELQRHTAAANGSTSSKMLPRENITRMVEISQSHTNIYERTADKTPSPLRGETPQGCATTTTSCLALNVSTDSRQTSSVETRQSGEPMAGNTKTDSCSDSSVLSPPARQHRPLNIRNSDNGCKEDAKDSNQRQVPKHSGNKSSRSSFSSNLKTPTGGLAGRRTEKRSDERDTVHCTSVKSSPRTSVSETVVEETTSPNHDNHSTVTPPTSVFKQLQLKHVKPYTSASNRGASIAEKFSSKGQGFAAERRKLGQRISIPDRQKDVPDGGTVTRKQSTIALSPSAAATLQLTKPDMSSRTADEKCHLFSLRTECFDKISTEPIKNPTNDDFHRQHKATENDSNAEHNKDDEMMLSSSAAGAAADETTLDYSPIASPDTRDGDDIFDSLPLDPQNNSMDSETDPLEVETLTSELINDRVTDTLPPSSPPAPPLCPPASLEKRGSFLKSHSMISKTIEADFETIPVGQRRFDGGDLSIDSDPLSGSELTSGGEECLVLTNRRVANYYTGENVPEAEDEDSSSVSETSRTSSPFSRHCVQLRETSCTINPKDLIRRHRKKQTHHEAQTAAAAAAVPEMRNRADSFVIKSANRNSLVLPNKILVQQDSAFRDIDKFVVTYESDNIIVLERAESISCPTPQSLDLKDVVFEMTQMSPGPNTARQAEGIRSSKSADLQKAESSSGIPLSESGYDSWKSQSSKASTRLFRPSESDLPEVIAQRRKSMLDVLGSCSDKNDDVYGSSMVGEFQSNSEVDDCHDESSSEDDTSSVMTETTVTTSKKRPKPVVMNIPKRNEISGGDDDDDDDNSDDDNNPEFSAETPAQMEGQTPTNGCYGYFQDDVVLKDGFAGRMSSDFRSCSIPSSNSSLLETIESINFTGTNSAEECSQTRNQEEPSLFGSETASPDRKSWSITRDPSDGNDFAFGSCFELSSEGMAFRSRDYHNRIYKLDFETERDSGELVGTGDDSAAEAVSDDLLLQQQPTEHSSAKAGKFVSGATDSDNRCGGETAESDYRSTFKNRLLLVNEAVNYQSLKSRSRERKDSAQKDADRDVMHAYTFPLDGNRCPPGPSEDLFKRKQQQEEAESVAESVLVISDLEKKKTRRSEKDTFYEHMCDALLESLEADLSDSDNTPSSIDNDLAESVEHDFLVENGHALELKACEQATSRGTRPSSSEFQVCLAQSSSSPELLEHLSSDSRIFSEDVGELKRSVAFSRLDSLDETAEAELRPLSNAAGYVQPCPMPAVEHKTEKKLTPSEPGNILTTPSSKRLEEEILDFVLEEARAMDDKESENSKEISRAHPSELNATKDLQWISQYYIGETRNDGRERNDRPFIQPKPKYGSLTEESFKRVDDSVHSVAMPMPAADDAERDSFDRRETRDPEEVSSVSSSFKEGSKSSTNILVRYFPGLMRKQAKEKNNVDDADRSGKKQDKWASLRNSAPAAYKNERKPVKATEPEEVPPQSVKDAIRKFEDKKEQPGTKPIKAAAAPAAAVAADKSDSKSQTQEHKQTSGKVIKSKFSTKQKPQK